MAKGLPRSTTRNPATGPVVVKRVIPLKNFPITAAAAGAGVGFGTAVFGDFPVGDILIVGAVCKLQFTTTSANITNAAFTGSFAIGSAPDANGTLTGGEVDVIPSTVLSAATGKVSPLTRGALAAPVTLDNNNGALELNLQMTVTDVDIADASSAPFTVSGYLSIAYVVL